MTKAESAILEAKTPEAYIEASLKAKLSPAAKARLARQWMERTGYTKDDILRARNRHPYWKRKKMEGSAERTRRRLSAHDYSSGKSVDWTRERIGEFLELNGKDGEGRYLRRDWELAEHFGATIPSIQYMRRKLRRVSEMLGPRASKPRLLEYLSRAESVLIKGPAAVESLNAAEKAPKARVKAQAPKPAKVAAPAKKTTEKPTAASKSKKAAPPAKPAAKPAAKTPVAKTPAAKKAAKPAPVAAKSAAKKDGAAKKAPAAKAKKR